MRQGRLGPELNNKLDDFSALVLSFFPGVGAGEVAPVLFLVHGGALLGRLQPRGVPGTLRTQLCLISPATYRHRLGKLGQESWEGLGHYQFFEKFLLKF